MIPDQDSPGYYIEDTLLLRFLIVRYTEMLEREKPNLVPVWAGLGMAALHQNKELQNAFKTLISCGSYTDGEVLTSSMDLFLAELKRLEMAESTDYVDKRIERRPLTPKTARKFLFWSWSEGRKMRRERDFRFYPIWEVLAYLALTSDEYVEEFERRCRFSQSSLKKRLDDGLEIVKTAIFRRSLDDAFFSKQLILGRTCSKSAPIDKETDI
jgi:hypothetical protein